LKHRTTNVVPGGGANAANNLVALGAKVFPVTVVGTDHAGDALVHYFRSLAVDISGIVRAKDWATPTKTRFLAGWTHTVAQQVLRVDCEPTGPPRDKLLMQLAAKLAGKLNSADALAVSDYGFGVAAPPAVKAAARGWKRKGIILLDARYRLDAYAN